MIATMPPRLILALVLALSGALSGAAGAAAQPAPTPETGVQVTQLAAPDAFTTPARDTGLPPSLWTGASVKTVRTVMGLLATKPLTPAGAALARRVLATGAPGPEGAQTDPGLAALRANALLMQGDAKGADVVLAHAPGADRSPELAQAAAEAALLAGDDPAACRTAQALTAGRDEAYWLKLRTYCQAIAGQTAQAQLTFDLAQAQAKDPIFARLMGAKLSGVGNPGAPAARNGLDVALSRSLGLDLAAAKPSPAVAAALADAEPAPFKFDLPAAPPDTALQAAAMALSQGDQVGGETFGQLLSGLMDMAHSTDPKTAAHGRAATLLVVMARLKPPLPADMWAGLAELDVPKGRAPLVRDLALDDAASRKAVGETAMLALWTLAEAGAAGPTLGDRVRIVRALHQAGLDADARAIAFEGLAGLK
jgi:hypothetical protein